jgi:hydroxymethylglutaryl-CoA reductase
MPGFYNKTIAERLQAIADQADLRQEELAFVSTTGLGLDGADHMIENVVGLYSSRLVLRPISGLTEKKCWCRWFWKSRRCSRCVVAARLAREAGGFSASSDEPVMIAQMQILDPSILIKPAWPS